MIKQKLKICSVCHEPSVLWASTPKMCKPCSQWAKIKSTDKTEYKQVTLKQTTDNKTAKVFKAISKVSDKRAKLDRMYNVMSSQFKIHNPECMAKLEGCTVVTSDVHHLYSGASRHKYYLDTVEWITVCSSCHHEIHDVMSKEQLFELGLKKTDI